MSFTLPTRFENKHYAVGLTLFWLGVFILNAGPHWEIYSSTREMIETAGMKTALQIFVALIALGVLVPRLLEKGHWRLFAVSLLIVVIITAEINIVVRVLYLEQHYPGSYKQFLSMFSEMSLAERMDLRWALRYILFTKLPQLTFPAVLIAAYQFYQKQQTLLQIKEQKISAELDALKNQLNPHFIFNTLNNIYSLALKKSDQTPVAIEKLSGILDYVVYRCNDKYVALSAEIKLIENYMGLEKIRYGDRLNVSLTQSISSQIKIAPLVLLTLLENACKHSTKEELNQATVDITIKELKDELHINISNSKPSVTWKPETSNAENENKVGLINLRKQLELLYPSKHTYNVVEVDRRYTSHLVLRIESDAQMNAQSTIIKR